MREPVEFVIHGTPKPAGSKRAFALKRGGVFTGRVAVTDDCEKSKDWKVTVSYAAAEAMKSSQALMFFGPVRATITFFMPRPKAHRNSKGALKATAPRWPQTKPDVLKLARGVEDAMSGIVYQDDSQIVIERLEKKYAELGPYCQVMIEEAVA